MNTQSNSSTIAAPIGCSIAAAVNMTGISRSKLYLEMAAGRIVARKVGSRTVIDAASLRDYFDSLPLAFEKTA